MNVKRGQETVKRRKTANIGNRLLKYDIERQKRNIASIDDALTLFRNGLATYTCMTFPTPRETEPALELEKRTPRLQAGVVRCSEPYTTVFKSIPSGCGGVD